jgi:hypothetical protein
MVLLPVVEPADVPWIPVPVELPRPLEAVPAVEPFDPFELPLPDGFVAPALGVGVGLQNTVSVVGPTGAAGCGLSDWETQAGAPPGVSANAGNGATNAATTRPMIGAMTLYTA